MKAKHLAGRVGSIELLGGLLVGWRPLRQLFGMKASLRQ
jgi:hypothetical protein